MLLTKCFSYLYTVLKQYISPFFWCSTNSVSTGPITKFNCSYYCQARKHFIPSFSASFSTSSSISLKYHVSACRKECWSLQSYIQLQQLPSNDNRKNDLILIMTPEKQDKTLELSKHWSVDSTPAKNEVIMKRTYPVKSVKCDKICSNY